MNVEMRNFKVKELLDLYANKMLTVNAEYQRGAVWKVPQKKRLIDSVLRSYPISLIYLHHINREVAGHRREDFEIVDGQQRISALYEFREGAFKLFDPVKDEATARFPAFLKNMECTWGGKDFDSLDPDTQESFLTASLPVALITTAQINEARDLFIRLQAGMPLNPQEKRDAWPGNFNEFILKVGGKPEIARYPGHDFFRVLMRARPGTGRGKFRQVAAQMAMLFLTRRRTGGERLCDINASAIDDFYYQHLDFDVSSTDAKRFVQALDKLTTWLGDGKRKKIAAHEAMHLVLLYDALSDDYVMTWESRFAEAFDKFREEMARDDYTSEFWTEYAMWTRSSVDREGTIRRRHKFFCRKMVEWLTPTLKDPQRVFGSLEREIIYYRDDKKCSVCGEDVVWSEAEIHHKKPHALGGRTDVTNAALVHRRCHPK